MEKKKNSKLGILALIFSILGFTFFVGIILAIIDLTKKDGRKKTLSIIALVISCIWLFGIIATSSGNKKSASSNNTNTETQVELSEEVEETASIPEPVVEENVVEEPEKEESIVEEEPKISMTKGQENALKKADTYLRMAGFSYNGLVEQLEFEGFSKEDAIFAADNCGADWNEQAARKAETYLDMTAFSRQGLIEQLQFEGFTTEQAEYAATAVGY